MRKLLELAYCWNLPLNANGPIFGNQISSVPVTERAWPDNGIYSIRASTEKQMFGHCTKFTGKNNIDVKRYDIAHVKAQLSQCKKKTFLSRAPWIFDHIHRGSCVNILDSEGYGGDA